MKIIKLNEEMIRYKDYIIDYIPDYGPYSIQIDGDDVLFDTLDDAKKCIDDWIAGEYQKLKSKKGLDEEEIEDFPTDKWADEIQLEELEDDDDSERFELIDSKSIMDMDGFYTDYSMYFDHAENKYVFIFGDKDIYSPEDSEPDWEADTESEAQEWFDNYTGFEDEL